MSLSSRRDTFKRLSLTYGCLLAGYVLFMVVAGTIPSGTAKYQIRKSAARFCDEGTYLAPVFHKRSATLDNYTDAYLLDIVYNIDSKRPFRSMMAGRFYTGETPFDGFCVDVHQNRNEQLSESYYGRYWLGQVAVMRILLTLMDYFQIRELYMAGILALTIIAAIRCYFRHGTWPTVALLAGLFAVNFVFTAFTLQFAPVFFIALGGLIYVQSAEHLALGHYKLIRAFFVIGSLTSFLDLLTAPVLTLTLPLLFLIWAKGSRAGNIRFPPVFKSLILLCISWGLGYSLTWIAKWPLAALCGCYLGILNPALYYLFGTGPKAPPTVVTNRLTVIFGSIQECKMLVAVIPLSIISWAWASIRRKRFIVDSVSGLLLFVGIIPWLWFMIMSYQAYHHRWFTFRSQAVTVGCVLADRLQILSSLKSAKRRNDLVERKRSDIIFEVFCYGPFFVHTRMKPEPVSPPIV